MNPQVKFTLPPILVRIKKLYEEAKIPKYAKAGDAGVDLYAHRVVSDDMERIVYGTGIAIEIPNGYVGTIFCRSSIRKYDLLLSNSVGIIDSGYRGELLVTFNKINGRLKLYKVDERIAQLIIFPYPEILFLEVESLSETDRGEGGFGSTGNA
jgi:dUTP pyrophosphatase